MATRRRAIRCGVNEFQDNCRIPTHCHWFLNEQIRKMNNKMNRRSFLGRSAWLGSAFAVGYHSSSTMAAASDSPNEKLNIAAVGTGNRAARNIAGVASENIVALADVDQQMLDKAGAAYSGARKYRDWRVMLEKEADRIDAVVVGTPDHMHAPASAMAMRMKKHVYCEKPLTNTVYEARTLAELAQQNSLVTQMGTQIHALDNYRRVVELVQGGSIGEIREVHVWTASNYTGRRLVSGKPAPSCLDWDLWLGPAPDRPYCEALDQDGSIELVHPSGWRWFWDFGSGSLGDYGCHFMDLAHWALGLKHPTSVSAAGPTPFVTATTAGLVVKYEYPSRGSLPPVTLTWYDGGRQPDALTTLKDANGQPLLWPSGHLFIGSGGMILSDYTRHMLLPAARFVGFQRPSPSIPTSLGHHQEWIHAIKTGGTTTCNFDYSGALTEAVLLGVASYRSGEAIQWDATNLQVTNSEHAQQYIHREYRQGWTL